LLTWPDTPFRPKKQNSVIEMIRFVIEEQFINGKIGIYRV